MTGDQDQAKSQLVAVTLHGCYVYSLRGKLMHHRKFETAARCATVNVTASSIKSLIQNIIVADDTHVLRIINHQHVFWACTYVGEMIAIRIVKIEYALMKK